MEHQDQLAGAGPGARTELAIRDARPGDAAGMARIQVEGWQTAYASFIPDCLPASYSYERRLGEWQARLEAPAPGTVHLVADSAGGLLGIAGGGPPLRDETIVEGGADEYTSQVYGLYVAPGHYRAGIGRRLLGRIAQRFADLGHGNLCLWAFELNPYRGFYARLGGATIARAEWPVGGTVVREIAYGWPRIGELIRACSTEEKSE
jgi:GNAT superfamily N-acetyltransferase